MRIQLVHPPVLRNPRAMTALRPSLPLGLAYVAAALRGAGHDVDVLDAVALAPEGGAREGALERVGLSPEELVLRLDPRCDAFGVTNMWSFSWPLVRRLLAAMRAAFPGKPIVCGGEHFTGLPERSLREAPIDCIVLGEGEETAVELFAALEQGRPLESVAGLAFLREERLVRTAPRARVRAVDALPWPAWDLFDLDAYEAHGLVNGLHAGRTIPILATRGCPYQCTYCSSPNMWTTRYVTRDPEDVVAEIATWNERYGATNFPLQDLTAIVKRDWIVRFCRALLARGLRITWQFPSGTRCEVVDDEVARLLKLSGARALAFAPESGSERTRERIGKRMKTESLLAAVRASVRHGLDVSCFFVLGFPDDTVQDFRDTERLVRQLARMGVDDVAVGYFFPLPGTRLFHELERDGRVRLDDAFLLTPIHANEARLRAQHNYSRTLSARTVTWWKARLLASFYGVSFALRPWRLARVLANALRGRETRKLESFLADRRRRALRRATVHRLPARRRAA